MSWMKRAFRRWPSTTWRDNVQLFSVIFSKMIYFLLLMILGFLLARLGLIPKNSISTLSGLVVKVFLPCLQMSLVFERGTTFGTFMEKGPFALVQLGCYGLLTLLGLGGVRLFRIRFPQRNSFVGGMISGNLGFLYIPLILSVFPEQQGYVPILAAVDTLYVWTVGLLFYAQGTERDGEKRTAGKFFRRLLNPIFVAILCAMTLSTLQIPLPQQLTEAVSSVGNVSGTVGLMLLGANIFYMNKHLKGRIMPMAGFVFLRQILAPIVVYVIAGRILGKTEAMLLMLLTGIPTMTTTGLLAIEYHTDVDFASNLVFFSTVSSLATIPLITFLSAYL